MGGASYLAALSEHYYLTTHNNPPLVVATAGGPQIDVALAMSEAVELGAGSCGLTTLRACAWRRGFLGSEGARRATFLRLGAARPCRRRPALTRPALTRVALTMVAASRGLALLTCRACPCPRISSGFWTDWDQHTGSVSFRVATRE